MIGTIILTVLIIGSTIGMYKSYKKSKTLDEKTLFWLIIVIVCIPLIIYYVDRYNLLTKSGWLTPDNSDRWFSFITTYVSSILGAVISAIVLILITIHEFKNMNDNNEEQKRINNLPLIEYGFEIYDDGNYKAIDVSGSHKKNQKVIIACQLKNIGMNTIRTCYINMSSDLVNDLYDYKINGQGFIKVNDIGRLSFRMPVEVGKINKLIIKVKYQDILLNWYEQEVLLTIDDLRFQKFYDPSADSIIEVMPEKLVNQNINLNTKE